MWESLSGDWEVVGCDTNGIGKVRYNNKNMDVDTKTLPLAML